MAKSTSKSTPQAPQIVSFAPDRLTQGGLPDDFDAEISKVRFLPFNYGGKQDKYIIAARVWFVPDPDSGLDPFDQYYSVGDLSRLAPADEDGNLCGGSIDDLKSLASGDGEIDEGDEDFEGVQLAWIGEGSPKDVSKSSNWGTFILAAKEAGFPEEKIGADCRTFEGVKAHFNRVNQPGRSGIVAGAEDSNRQKQVLVMTEVYNTKTKKSAGAKTTTTTATTAKTGNGKSTTTTTATAAASKTAKSRPAGGTSSASSDTGDLDSRLQAAVVDALGRATDQTLKKGNVPSKIFKAFATNPKEKTLAVNRVVEDEFLEQGAEAGLWLWDDDEGTLTLLEGAGGEEEEGEEETED